MFQSLTLYFTELLPSSPLTAVPRMLVLESTRRTWLTYISACDSRFIWLLVLMADLDPRSGRSIWLSCRSGSRCCETSNLLMEILELS